MTIGALAISEPIPHGTLPTTQALALVTGCACELLMLAFQGIGRDLGMVERFDLESVRDVASITLTLGRGETKLSGMNVAMTSRTFTRRTPVRRASVARQILRGWGVTAVTGGLGMSAGQWPTAVIDAGCVPPALRVTVRASPIAHLDRELIAVRIVVTIRTRGGTKL